MAVREILKVLRKDRMVHRQSGRLPHKPKAPNKARKSHSTKPQRGLETGNTKQHLQAGGA